MATALPAKLGQAQIALGILFGVGGDQWAGERTTGDGEVTPVVTQTFTITAYVRQIKPPQVQVSPDAFTSDTDWIMVAAMGQNIEAGDIFTSVAQPVYRFQVLPSPDTTRGIIEATLERVSSGNA